MSDENATAPSVTWLGARRMAVDLSEASGGAIKGRLRAGDRTLGVGDPVRWRPGLECEMVCLGTLNGGLRRLDSPIRGR